MKKMIVVNRKPGEDHGVSDCHVFLNVPELKIDWIPVELSEKLSAEYCNRISVAKHLEMCKTGMLYEFGIADVAHRLLCKISKLNQRKVALAKALTKSVEVIILIEPFAGLNEKDRLVLEKDLLSIMERGIQVVIYSENFPENMNSDYYHRIEKWYDAERGRLWNE